MGALDYISIAIGNIKALVYGTALFGVFVAASCRISARAKKIVTKLRPVISSPCTQTCCSPHDCTTYIHSGQIRGQSTDLTARLILPDTDIKAAGVQYQLGLVRNRVDGHAGDFMRSGDGFERRAMGDLADHQEIDGACVFSNVLVLTRFLNCSNCITAPQYILEKQHQAHITFSGDEIPEEESAIVMANHRSWTDFYMIHSVAIRKKMLSNCKYFVKDSIKYLPLFGWGMWLMGMIFVKRNWVKDQQKINQMFAKINEFKPPVWIISFVEGTRFTPQKLLDGQLFSQERGLPVMKNLLVPRTKGFVACIQKLRGSHVQYIYDLTIAYNHRVESKKGFGVAPDMVRIHAGRLSPEFDFHIHVRRYPIAELPLEDEALADWVRERYLEKDRVLERLKDKWIDGIEGGVWEENW